MSKFQFGKITCHWPVIIGKGVTVDISHDIGKEISEAEETFNELDEAIESVNDIYDIKKDNVNIDSIKWNSIKIWDGGIWVDWKRIV